MKINVVFGKVILLILNIEDKGTYINFYYKKKLLYIDYYIVILLNQWIKRNI